jgi:hypothetical protein
LKGTICPAVDPSLLMAGSPSVGLKSVLLFSFRGTVAARSSFARALGSCVRIPLKAWMSVCVYSVFVLFCVLVAALRRADPAFKESYRLSVD